MSVETVRRVSEERLFAPEGKFAYLASDHVSLDDLTGTTSYESRTLRAVTTGPAAAAVIAPVGGGKSSLIADICAHLPETHVALRVPILGLGDPTNTSAMAAMALATALQAVKFDAAQRAALKQARADRIVAARTSRGLGGRLGGGPFPVELHGELGTLETQLASDQLAGERLAGLDRLVSLLIFRGRQPIFVLEDTEAAVGGRDQDDVIEGFFAGPVTAFVREVDAACLIAVQDEIAAQEPFQRLAPSLLRVVLPRFAHQGATVLTQILAHRLAREPAGPQVDEVLSGEAVDLLGAFYGRTGKLRHALAAAQTAADHSADVGAERIGPGAMRGAISEWSG